MRKQKGFSLIELLIVVAIILIIAAIAIPNLLRSRISANEASAVASLRSIDTAMISYAVTYPDAGFNIGSDLVKLGPASGTPPKPTSDLAGLLDAQLASGTKSGYSFGMTSSDTTFTATATPITAGQTGIRSFCSDQSAVIYYSPTESGCAVGTNPLQ